MNRLRFASLLFALTAPLAAADAAKTDRVEVVFEHPENFTDVKASYNDFEAGRAGILRELSDYLAAVSKWYVPEGDKLTLTFTDVDLAGDFEPWRGPQFDDVRIVKSIYPPAFKFRYRVTGPDGKVLKEGEERLRDINFQDRITANTQDALHYEKDILKDWMSKKLSDLKKR